MKSRIVSYLFILLASVVLLSACSNRPREVLNRRAMERLMYDIYIAEATMDNDFRNFSSPEQKEAFIRQVFLEHRVTQAQWDASLAWYANRIDLYLQMNDSVKVRLQREQVFVDALIAQIAAQQESDVSIFADSYIPRIHSFSTPSARSGFSFHLDSLELAERFPDDEFEFRFRVIGVSSSGVPGFQAILTLDYIDTTLFLQRRITDNIAYNIPIQRFIERDSVTMDTLRGLSGFVRLPDIYRVFTNIHLYDISLGVAELEEELEEELLEEESEEDTDEEIDSEAEPIAAEE